MTPEQAKFVDWLKAKDPFLYAVAVKNYQIKTGQLSGLSGFDFSSFLTSVGDAVAKVAPQIAQVKLLNTQIKRAKEGMPPIDVQSYTSVNPGYSPLTSEGQYAVNYAARTSQGAGLMSFIPWAVGGALIFLLVNRYKKGGA